MQIGIKNRLLPDTSACFRHNRCDYIYKLRKTGDLHTAAVLHQRDEQTADHKGILKRIDILE